MLAMKNRQTHNLFYRIFISSNIYLLLVTYLSITFFFSYLSLQNSGIATTFILILLGMLSWSFIEYLVHRFLFHGTRKSKVLQKLQYFMHGYHHIQPRDPNRLVLPFILTLPLSTSIYFLLLYIVPNLADGLFVGCIFGYISYDVTHYVIHRTQPVTKLGKYRRSHHYHHHFRNHDQCFGVTSPLWDFVFGTTRKQKS